jgi:aminoglycoside 3-N-acetyltransferase
MIHPAATLATPGPFSSLDLTRDLRTLGVSTGEIVLVHASIRSLGWVSGGGVALLEALREAVGPRGAVIVPTFTTYMSDPQMWTARPVPPAWWESIRTTLPGFDRHLHASQPGLGRFPEIVRTHGTAVRSGHPLFSLAGVGEAAASLLADSPHDWALGVNGPLQRITDAGGKILTIGIPWWSRCTLFHLAEHQADYPGRLMYTIPARIQTPDGPRWEPTKQLVFHDGDFEPMGAACGHALLGTGTVGAAEAVLVDGAQLVSGAARWLIGHRNLTRARLQPPFHEATAAPAGAL